MGKIKIDLHDIYNNSRAIESVLQQAFNDAIAKKIKEIEICFSSRISAHFNRLKKELLYYGFIISILT